MRTPVGAFIEQNILRDFLVYIVQPLSRVHIESVFHYVSPKKILNGSIYEVI